MESRRSGRGPARGWVETAGGYAVTLDGTQVLCRNAAGRTLKQVPAKLRDDAEVVRLRQLAERLERHERECRAQVDTWLMRSLPVPARLLDRVWPDAAWQGALRDLVVAPVGADGSAVVERAGFLRDADPERGIGIVDLDGDSVRLDAEQVLIPHPALLEDLDDLREFAAELGVEQGLDQLFREVWPRPEDIDGTARVGCVRRRQVRGAAARDRESEAYTGGLAAIKAQETRPPSISSTSSTPPRTAHTSRHAWQGARTDRRTP
ncbi:DUF4132 domain-containing protein [Streptomyces sp. NPDC041068]|uniref:DUF4132 domain-containing protein n=1 Tax=Streptomyces sp. NPDC041068 TaxID=3155130 RepID=UPI0033FDA097